ncbi:MAG TPA: GAF domain-containing protein, partial [Chromatiales bacterium]|nr:GAF domain-containing protein [Chromatiales bacterium]
MLHVLQRIVQEVNDAETLESALSLIVRRVRRALSVDVCSVYLLHQDSGQLVLMATEGLDPRAVGRVRLHPQEGVVGLVAERAEPVNLEDAASHPRYVYFPETGEECYCGFLGVPIVQHRRVLGVLVVQQRQPRRFDDEHLAFLVTLAAQLAGPIVHAELAGSALWRADPGARTTPPVQGVAGAPGVAIGTAAVAFSGRDLDSVPDRPASNIDAEVKAFRAAVERVQNELHRMKLRSEGLLPSEERVLFDAYVMLVSSDALLGRVIERIRNGQWAPAALRDTIRDNAAVFEAMPDPYLRERAADIRDLGERLLMYLEGAEAAERTWPERTVLVGENVTVNDLADIEPQRLMGVISGQGSATSHVAILARALGVPAVMGAAELPFGRLEGREVVVDGYAGKIFIDPPPHVRQEFERLLREEAELTRGLENLSGLPAQTLDGVRIPLYVNSGLLAEINAVFQSEADGIGLYRTEFPFIVRERFPTEEEQVV